MVKAQTEQCTEEIPVKFTYNNATQNGYMDPKTLTISHYGHPTDCSLVENTPLQLYDAIKVYNRKDGTLRIAGDVQDLRVVGYHWTETHGRLFAPQIFRPVVMYTWEEMTPTTNLNALLKTTAAQAEVMAILGAQFEGEKADSGQMADEMAKNIVLRGMASVKGVMGNPFHVWVTLTCMAMTLGLIHRLAKWLKKQWLNILKCGKEDNSIKKERRVTLAELERLTTERQNVAENSNGEEEPIEAVINRSRNSEFGFVRAENNPDGSC
jgi:hypothetical protein